MISDIEIYWQTISDVQRLIWLACTLLTYWLTVRQLRKIIR